MDAVGQKEAVALAVDFSAPSPPPPVVMVELTLLVGAMGEREAETVGVAVLPPTPPAPPTASMVGVSVGLEEGQEVREAVDVGDDVGVGGGVLDSPPNPREPVGLGVRGGVREAVVQVVMVAMAEALGEGEAALEADVVVHCEELGVAVPNPPETEDPADAVGGSGEGVEDADGSSEALAAGHFVAVGEGEKVPREADEDTVAKMGGLGLGEPVLLLLPHGDAVERGL